MKVQSKFMMVLCSAQLKWMVTAKVLKIKYLMLSGSKVPIVTTKKPSQSTYSSSHDNHIVLINMMDNAATPEAKEMPQKKLLDYDREMGENFTVPDNAVKRAKFTWY